VVNRFYLEQSKQAKPYSLKKKPALTSSEAMAGCFIISQIVALI